jgi:hypothetical protein
MVGKAPAAAGLALYRALAQSANSKKIGAGKNVRTERKQPGFFRRVRYRQKKRKPALGKAGLLLRRKEIRVAILTYL